MSNRIQFIITETIKCKFGDAIRDNGMDVCKFLGRAKMNIHTDSEGNYIHLDTRNGLVKVRYNDFIIKHEDGTLEVQKN